MSGSKCSGLRIFRVRIFTDRGLMCSLWGRCRCIGALVFTSGQIALRQKVESWEWSCSLPLFQEVPILYLRRKSIPRINSSTMLSQIQNSCVNSEFPSLKVRGRVPRMIRTEPLAAFAPTGACLRLSRL